MIKLIIIFMLFLMVISNLATSLIAYHKGIRDGTVIIQTDEAVIDAACEVHGLKECGYHISEDGNPGYFFFYIGQEEIPNPKRSRWSELFNIYFRERYYKEIAWKM